MNWWNTSSRSRRMTRSWTIGWHVQGLDLRMESVQYNADFSLTSGATNHHWQMKRRQHEKQLPRRKRRRVSSQRKIQCPMSPGATVNVFSHTIPLNFHIYICSLHQWMAGRKKAKERERVNGRTWTKHIDIPWWHEWFVPLFWCQWMIGRNVKERLLADDSASYRLEMEWKKYSRINMLSTNLKHHPSQHSWLNIHVAMHERFWINMHVVQGLLFFLTMHVRTDMFNHHAPRTQVLIWLGNQRELLKSKMKAHWKIFVHACDSFLNCFKS